MKREDLLSAPKLFCESISVAFTPEYFVMGLTSGNQGTLYTLTPQHTKRLQQYLTHQIKEFEEKHGEIDFANRVSFPEAWAGLMDGELEEVSGIEGAVVCTKERYVFVATTKAAAIAAAHMLLE